MSPNVNSNSLQGMQKQSIDISENVNAVIGVSVSGKEEESEDSEEIKVDQNYTTEKIIELDTGNLKVRIRSRWYQFWCVSIPANIEQTIHYGFPQASEACSSPTSWQSE